MDLNKMQLLERLLKETQGDALWAAQQAGVTNTDYMRFHLPKQLAEHGDPAVFDLLLNPQEQRRVMQAYEFARHLQAGFRLSPFHRRRRGSAPTHFELRGGVGIVVG